MIWAEFGVKNDDSVLPGTIGKGYRLVMRILSLILYMLSLSVYEILHDAQPQLCPLHTPV